MENIDYFLLFLCVYDVIVFCLVKFRNGSEVDMKYDIKKNNLVWVIMNFSKCYSVLLFLKFKDGCLKIYWCLCIGMIIGFYEWCGNVE